VGEASHTPERLAYMAGQIARNLAHEDDPAAATAAHIRKFWTPAMIAMLRENAIRLDLDEPAKSAIELI